MNPWRRFSHNLFNRALCCIGLVILSQTGRSAIYEWNFALGNLDAALGNGSMTYADGAATAALTTFGLTDGTTVPHINGQPASYLHLPAFSDAANGYQLTLTDSGPNGGGAYINQFTIILDVLAPGSPNWIPFFNTDPNNGNDADFYVSPSQEVGIGALGYTSPGTFAMDTWYRVAFAADLGAGNVSYYLDGNSILDRTGGSLLDGRFSLYSNADPGPDVLLFNEGDASGQYTHELFVSSVYLTDRTLSAQEILALGGPNAFGIVAVPEPSICALIGLGALGLLMSRRRTD